MSLFRTLLMVGLAFTMMSSVWPDLARASKGKSSVSYGSSEGGGSSSHQEMMIDLSANYVRGTDAESETDTAARFSIAGMFTPYLGLDATGLYEVKSKSYLVGSNLRFYPTDWFFVKGGLGAYADKKTRELKATPLAGVGIMARITRDYYFLTESNYFQVNSHSNISFGAGVGMSF